MSKIIKYQKGKKVSTSIPYEAPNPWKETIPKQTPQLPLLLLNNPKPIIGYKPLPWQKPYVLPEVPILARENRSEEEMKRNREQQEGDKFRRVAIGSQLFFNNFVNGALNLDPKQMIYAEPTGPQITREVQRSNNETTKENFLRTTLPTITNATVTTLLGQGMQKLLPYLPKGYSIVKNRLGKIERGLPEKIVAPFKPTYNLKFSNPSGGQLGEGTFEGKFLKNKSYLNRGGENYVYQDLEHVYKVRNPYQPISSKGIEGLKKELLLLEEYGAPKTTIVGYNKNIKTGVKQPILKQSFIEGEHPTYSMLLEKMKEKGFEPVELDRVKTSVFKNNKHRLSDIHSKNVIVDKSGNIRIIDGKLEKITSDSPSSSQHTLSNEGVQLLSNVKPKINTGQDLSILLQIAKQNAKDYINHPIVLKTAERNQALLDRLGKRTFVDYSRPTFQNRYGYKTMSLTEGRNNFLNRGYAIKFKALNEPHTGAQIDGTNIDVNWNRHIGSSQKELILDLEHEFLHGARYGNTTIERLKLEKLLKPDKELTKILLKNDFLRVKNLAYQSDLPDHYLTSLGETQTNMYDLLKTLNVSLGQEYPGRKLLSVLLDWAKNNSSKGFVVDALRLNNPRDYKRVWDALNGNYFTLPLTGLITYQSTKK